MEKFTPKEKLSKKAQKELNRKQREQWQLSPVTRKAISKKVYSRKKICKTDDGYDESFFIYIISVSILIELSSTIAITPFTSAVA